VTIYHYDGTFEGLLTAVVTAWEKGERPEAISRRAPSQGNLFQEVVEIAAAEDSFDRLDAASAGKLSPFTLRTAWHAFLAEAPGGELALFRYLEMGRRVGKSLDGMLAHELVAPVHRLAQRVRTEAHRMKGFIRFRETAAGFFYARFEPDHHVLPLVAPHFAGRLPDQHWVIHDLRRSMAAVHDAQRREWALTGLGLDGNPDFSEAEERCAGLWRRWFARAAIAGRANPALQQQKVPLKYRTYLLEF
jgi:probable DNA metabolism protein